MCGIAGIVNFSGPEEKLPLLRKMIGLLRHRGPDEAGVYLDGPVGLGHARLSIIDLSSGSQPIWNEDRTAWVVFNGEIFNYPELRADLEKVGHRFYTQTDTEVLIHLYEQYGTGMFEKLNGQFAFAIWDQRKSQLLLARDRVGIRPLFFYTSQKRLIFASEIKAIFADDFVPRRLNPEALSDVFTCWSVFGRETPFLDVLQLPPAHFAIFSQDGLEIESYWDIQESSGPTQNLSLADWVASFQALLLDATRIRLRADVPVGAYLSGGIDSTYTSALVKKHFNNRLCTFSVAFTNPVFDETTFQETAIRHLETDHRVTRCDEKAIAQAFPEVVWHCETPLLRTAPAPLYLLSRLVTDTGFKVVLTGEGADEILSGYNIFKEAQVRRFWARNPDSPCRPKLLERLYPYIFHGSNEKAKAYLKGFFKKSLGSVGSPVYSHLLRWQNTSQLHGFFNQDFFPHQTLPLERFLERFNALLPSNFMDRNPLSRAQYIEMKIFLSNYLLSTQGDRMAMAHSVEGRYPFLDHRVVEFAFQLPARYRMNGLTEKFILKKAAAGLVPEEIINRSKQPYRAPISSVFFAKDTPAFVDEMLAERKVREKGYFDTVRVASLVKKCRKNRSGLLSERENMALVGILSTQLLDEQFIRNFPHKPVNEPDKLLVCDKNGSCVK